MMTLLSGFQGYSSRTFTYKTVDSHELKLDVLYPLEPRPTATPVLLHYHGGFLIIGDRYSLLPYWLIKACTSRKWIFVTADYRLLPETTAHRSVEDARDAYEWVVQQLASTLNIKTGPVILAGSSAGAYLALTAASMTLTAAPVDFTPPRAMLLLYGLLDPSYERYTTRGTNILGLPPINPGPILEGFASTHDTRGVIISGYSWPENLPEDPRFALIQAAHIAARIPDIMTGVDGLSEAIAAHGPEASIAASERKLFAVAFGALSGLPPTLLIHGRNDIGVPFAMSQLAAEGLKSCGVDVTTEFPDDAQHGFDVMLGHVDLDESTQVRTTPAVESLRKALEFLDRVAK